MSEKKAKGCLVAALIWCFILGALAVGYRVWIHPKLQDRLTQATSSTSQYRAEIVVAADSFSGYAVLRSPILRDLQKKRQIKVQVEDDQADYLGRLKALQTGKAQLAVFTIDSLLTASEQLGESPAAIVLLVDETVGSDALVARTNAVNAIQDLNHAEARIVATPNSPSEFLARVVIAHFSLPNLPNDWIIPADGAQAVFNQLRDSPAGERRAYVLWEPYVTQALTLPGVEVLLDSAKLKGYIVDVLVAERSFLRDHPDRVGDFVEDYLRAAYSYAQQKDGYQALIQADASTTSADRLNDGQAANVVKGIRWKNTLENYAHFGLLTPNERLGLPHLEDIIGNIVNVLVQTGAFTSDPLKGDYHTLFYGGVLSTLKQQNFHPGKGLNVIGDLGPGTGALEAVRGTEAIPELSPEEWRRLRPVGALRVDPIQFVRGSARLSGSSERELQALAKRLDSFPNFYLRVIGHARPEGDPAANKELAQARAESAAGFLRDQGLSPARLQTASDLAEVQSGAGQTVTFEVGQLPY